MEKQNFIHLSVHSAYSLSEGAIVLDKLVKLAVEHKMPALALTDSDNLFGALEFAKMAADAGVKPIIGCQVTLLADAESYGQHQLGSHRLTLLAQDETGWRNLMQLVSASYLQNEAMLEAAAAATNAIALSSHVNLDLLAQHSVGVIAFSGGQQGEIALKLMRGQDDAARKLFDHLRGIFPNRFYVELQRYPGTEHDTIAGDTRNKNDVENTLIDWAYETNLPLIATNDVYFPRPDMYEAHDVLLAIAEGVTRDAAPRRRVTPHHYFKSAAEMAELFADLPEAIENSLVIAQRCSIWPKSQAPILPQFLAEKSNTGEAERRASEKALLRQNAEAGMLRRFTAHPPVAPATVESYKERLDFELGVIHNMGYDGYFLIVSDFITWAKDHHIPVGPGRGSGVGSLVAYATGITDLDPIPFNLLFERFLNPERVSLPDFDVDFCQDRRDEVIKYVCDRYGADRVAQIITFGKFQARAVLRDVGRALAMPYGQVDRICKIVPQNPAAPISLGKAIEKEPQLRAQRDSDPVVQKLLEIGMQLEGLYRHASTHAAGVVIADRPLTEIIPLYRDPRSSLPATQYSMKLAESAGLVKFDFLGLKTLTVIAKTIQLIEQSEGVKIILEELPLSDNAVWKMLARGETTGVFQLESSGMRDVVMKLNIDRFEEIIAVVSLFRPGPMDNIPSFINRKHRREASDYLHPALEGILRETFGIMIYQEQVMQIAQELAGFTLGQADLLRRAMGKKDPKEMAKLSAEFAEGAARKHGVPANAAKHIFDQMEKFAGYGFNKSHAAAYALVSWQTAWLKCHYPCEFLAASMTLDMNNTDKLDVLRQEIAKLGLSLLPPDLNESQVEFSVERDAKTQKKRIRYGLAAVKNVGAAAMEKLVTERAERGKFASLVDLAERIEPQGLNKRQLEQLAAAGAFDGILPNAAQNRAIAFAAAEGILAIAAQQARARHSNQSALFDAVGKDGQDAQDAKAKMATTRGDAIENLEKSLIERGILPPSVKIAAWSDEEKRSFEKTALGFYLTAHPLADYRPRLSAMPEICSSKSLTEPQILNRKEIRLAGLVVECRERTAKSGNKFAFVQVSDEFGSFEIMVFQAPLANYRNLLESGQKILLTLKAKEDNRGNYNGGNNGGSGGSGANGGDSGQRLLLERAQLLDEYLATQPAYPNLLTHTDAAAPGIQAMLASSMRGNFKLSVRVQLELDSKTHLVLIQSPKGFHITDDMLRNLRSLPDLSVDFGRAR